MYKSSNFQFVPAKRTFSKEPLRTFCTKRKRFFGNERIRIRAKKSTLKKQSSTNGFFARFWGISSHVSKINFIE